MSRISCLILGAFAVLFAGCTETPVSSPLRSLEGSQDVSFVCLGPGGEGRKLSDCPDFEGPLADHLYALVTQEKGEVAVVDHHEGVVVDADPSTPGYTFLHIGGDPRDIVSTPGGAATFVGVAEVGREGIFGIPSTCIGAPGPGDTGRDLTTWPACSLPSAPGSMAVLIDPPDSLGNERDRCPGTTAVTPTDGAANAGNECPADLTAEPGPSGRRKLAVALPELGRIDIFDAQALLNREPGSFQPCDLDLEAQIPLRVDLPTTAVQQRLPPDLQAPGCVGPVLNHGPRPERFEPQPSGFALGGDVLYVGDRRAPVIHVLDIADPCAVAERPAPLLPVSYLDPNRVVTTTELALSDPTSLEQRFLYALDVSDSSVMVFDLAPGADRTPLVRPGTDRLQEPPDRIRFAGAAVASLTFGRRDLPIVDEENNISVNPFCNPDPGISESDPAARYRPAADRSRGAAPAKLRGIFGFVALKSGEVVVIDVEDYDAPCRRPVASNSGPTEDFRGCKNDPDVRSAENPDGIFALPDETPTVTDEVSCRVVQPHLARSASFVLTDDNGVRAPSLRTLPRFTTPGEANSDRSVFPKLLATDYPPSGGPNSIPAEVYVGTDKFTTAQGADNKLEIDPALAEEHSLVLPWVEPRSYPTVIEQTLVFEGMFSQRSGPGVTGRIRDGRFLDQNHPFCNSGVQDKARAREWGTELGLTRDQDLALFERDHADVVQITANIPARDDTFWQSDIGAACADGRGYFGCLDEFGPGAPDAPVVNPCPAADGLFANRDLIVNEAFQSELVVEPSTPDQDAQRRILNSMQCCFPSVVSYRIRGGKQWIVTGSGSVFRTDITAQREPNGNRFRCVKDCRPQRRWQKARAIEIPPTDQCNPTGATPCPACSSSRTGPVAPNADDPRSKCIFESLTSRFVVYAGSLPSERDMCFSWVTNGGFTPLAARLTSQTLSVSPVSMTFLPEIGQLAVVDGSAAGLVFVSLESIGVSRLFF